MPGRFRVPHDPRQIAARMSTNVQRRIPPAEVGELLASCGLTTGGPGHSGGSDTGQTVLRGPRPRQSFSLEAPVVVVAEDVPEEVTALFLGATHLYELLIEGSSAAGVSHALRFAKELAVACGGVVLDPQAERTWHRGHLRAVERVQSGVIDVVELAGTRCRRHPRWSVFVDPAPSIPPGLGSHG